MSDLTGFNVADYGGDSSGSALDEQTEMELFEGATTEEEDNEDAAAVSAAAAGASAQTNSFMDDSQLFEELDDDFLFRAPRDSLQSRRVGFAEELEDSAQRASEVQGVLHMFDHSSAPTGLASGTSENGDATMQGEMIEIDETCNSDLSTAMSGSGSAILAHFEARAATPTPVRAADLRRLGQSDPSDRAATAPLSGSEPTEAVKRILSASAATDEAESGRSDVIESSAQTPGNLFFFFF